MIVKSEPIRCAGWNILNRNGPVFMTNFCHLINTLADDCFNFWTIRCPNSKPTIAFLVKCSHRRIFVAHQILKVQLVESFSLNNTTPDMLKMISEKFLKLKAGQLHLVDEKFSETISFNLFHYCSFCLFARISFSSIEASGCSS